MNRIRRRKYENRLTTEYVIELLQGSSEQEPKSIQDLTKATHNQYNHASLRIQLNKLIAEGLVDRKEEFFRGEQVRWAYWLKSGS